MNILRDPADMANALIELCHVKDAASFYIIFGRWCDQNQSLPPIYIRSVAAHIVTAADLA